MPAPKLQAAQLSLLDEAPPAPKPARTSPTPCGKAPVVAVKARPKTVRVTAPPKQAAQAVAVVPELPLTGGALWKMSGRHGVAYVKDAALAGELLAVEPRHLAKAAMAVYYDRKGKAFAWQVRFDTERWEEVRQRLA
jgi:hypothetical protein